VKIIDKLPDEANYIAHWMDFWFTNDPTTLIWIYKFDWWLILDEELYKTWLTNDDISKIIQEIWLQKVKEVFADSSEPKSIEEIYRNWINIKPVEKWPDSVKFGIDLMKTFPISVTAKSINLIKEFRKYVWATDKNWNPLNSPIDDFNHWIDASRYAIMMKLKKTQKSPWIWLGGEYFW
jgi:phage terminase large subunit